MRFHTLAVDFLPPPVIGEGMARIASWLASGECKGMHATSAGPTIARHIVNVSELFALLCAGDIATLPPLAYPLGSAASALRQLAAARHVGKVVVADSSDSGSRSDGRWTISGGTGALGALTARWLAAGGAKHIILLGRTGVKESPAAPAAAAGSTHPASVLAAATSTGSWASAVTLLKCDAAAAADAAAVLDAAAGSARERLPLAGVLHAGGLLRDATLQNQTLPSLRAVLAPKAAGTSHLAAAPAATLQPLAAVKLFSSVAAALGSGGQANYAAANALLESTASSMQQGGLPGVAVSWGAWAGAGMAAHAGDVEGLAGNWTQQQCTQSAAVCCWLASQSLLLLTCGSLSATFTVACRSGAHGAAGLWCHPSGGRHGSHGRAAALQLPPSARCHWWHAPGLRCRLGLLLGQATEWQPAVC